MLSRVTGNYQINYANHQIAFAKTHKTGSSTLQNILFRWKYKLIEVLNLFFSQFGDERNLTFAMPVKKYSFPTSFHNRFGDSRNLTFAIPERSWMYSFQEPFHHSMIRWGVIMFLKIYESPILYNIEKLLHNLVLYLRKIHTIFQFLIHNDWWHSN